MWQLPPSVFSSSLRTHYTCMQCEAIVMILYSIKKIRLSLFCLFVWRRIYADRFVFHSLVSPLCCSCGFVMVEIFGFVKGTHTHVRHTMHPFSHFGAFSLHLCSWTTCSYVWLSGEGMMHVCVLRTAIISKYNSTSTLNKLIGKINSSHFTLWSRPQKRFSFHCLLISNGKTHFYIRKIYTRAENRILHVQFFTARIRWTQTMTNTYIHTQWWSGRKFSTKKFENRGKGMKKWERKSDRGWSTIRPN